MDSLACMSARTCPSCWRFRGGRCDLNEQLAEVERYPMGLGQVRLAAA